MKPSKDRGLTCGELVDQVRLNDGPNDPTSKNIVSVCQVLIRGIVASELQHTQGGMWTTPVANARSYWVR